jgi:hypothetical protein
VQKHSSRLKNLVLQTFYRLFGIQCAVTEMATLICGLEEE